MKCLHVTITIFNLLSKPQSSICLTSNFIIPRENKGYTEIKIKLKMFISFGFGVSDLVEHSKMIYLTVILNFSFHHCFLILIMISLTYFSQECAYAASSRFQTLSQVKKKKKRNWFLG